MKVVINKSIGSFNVPRHIVEELIDLGVQGAEDEVDIIEADDLLTGDFYPLMYVERNDPALIKTIEKYQQDVPRLKIINIPDDIEFYIHTDEDGREYVHEDHRVWS